MVALTESWYANNLGGTWVSCPQKLTDAPESTETRSSPQQPAAAISCPQQLAAASASSKPSAAAVLFLFPMDGCHVAAIFTGCFSGGGQQVFQ